MVTSESEEASIFIRNSAGNVPATTLMLSRPTHVIRNKSVESAMMLNSPSKFVSVPFSSEI